VIIEIERLHSHVLLIAHRVVARILLAYYLNLSHQVYYITIQVDADSAGHFASRNASQHVVLPRTQAVRNGGPEIRI
jgi:broad specificity phosphatase PhoE